MGRGKIVWAIVLSAAGLFLLVGAFFFFRPDRSARERVEVEHSITLPPSARDIQAMGDASGSVWVLLELDRGASSILVIDRDEIPQLLESFDLVPGDVRGEESSLACFGGAAGPAPGNSVYQPDEVPWPDGLTAEARYIVLETPGNADIACVYLYELGDPTSVGVWIYSDWN